MTSEQPVFANLTEKELRQLKKTEEFLNSQPDHSSDREEGREIILLAYSVKK